MRAAEADATLNEFGVHDAGVGPAERRPQLVPEGLPAIPGDPAQARRQRPDDAADRGRHRGPARPATSRTTCSPRPARARSACACSASRGTCRSPRSAAVRRSTSTTSSATRSAWRARSSKLLRPRALQGAHQRVPAPRGRRGRRPSALRRRGASPLGCADRVGRSADGGRDRVCGRHHLLTGGDVVARVQPHGADRGLGVALAGADRRADAARPASSSPLRASTSRACARRSPPGARRAAAGCPRGSRSRTPRRRADGAGPRGR